MIINIAFFSVFIIILIYFSGWFSSAETSITNISDIEIAQMNRNRSKNIRYIIKLKKDLLSTK